MAGGDELKPDNPSTLCGYELTEDEANDLRNAVKDWPCVATQEEADVLMADDSIAGVVIHPAMNDNDNIP